MEKREHKTRQSNVQEAERIERVLSGWKTSAVS